MTQSSMHISAFLTALDLLSGLDSRSKGNNGRKNGRAFSQADITELLELVEQKCDYLTYTTFLDAYSAIRTYPDLLIHAEDEIRQYKNTKEGKRFIREFEEQILLAR
jgi:predicted transcriptional regulator